MSIRNAKIRFQADFPRDSRPFPRCERTDRDDRRRLALLRRRQRQHQIFLPGPDDADNFGELEIKWRWQSIDGRFNLDQLKTEYPNLLIANDVPEVSINGLKAAPLAVDGVLYVFTPLYQAAAVDALTGKRKLNEKTKGHPSKTKGHPSQLDLREFYLENSKSEFKFSR